MKHIFKRFSVHSSRHSYAGHTRPFDGGDVRFRSDFIHSDHIRRHGTNQHENARILGAGIHHIRSGSQIKPADSPGSACNLTPFITYAHFVAPIGQISDHIPQNRRLSAFGR